MEAAAERAEEWHDWTNLRGLVLFAIIKVIEHVYGLASAWFVEWRNFPYQQDHQDELALWSFIFNFYNTVFPLCFVAFFEERPFRTLITVLVSLFVLEQAVSNLWRYCTYYLHRGKIRQVEAAVAEAEEEGAL